MKQSAAKTLGVAALGAAFAAAAAGTATAAPAVPAPLPSLDAVTSVLPVQDLPVQDLAVQEALTKLPAGAPESLAGGQNALTDAAGTLPGALEGTTDELLPGEVQDVAAAPTAPVGTDAVSGLLGGLPIGGGLPTGALPGLG